MDERSDSRAEIRMAEVVACLSLATDLATGQPLEHGLRRTLLAVWLGEELKLNESDLATAYYVALLGAVGCILDGAALSNYVNDEIAVRQKLVTLDPTNPLQVVTFFARQAGKGDPPVRRLGKIIGLATQQSAVCRDVALQVGRLLDLGPAIKEALGQCEEHWNGKGPVLGLKGEGIHVAARLFLLCHDVEIFNRIGGPDAAIKVVRKRSGRLYDPRMAECFREVGGTLLARLQMVPGWEATLAAEPAPVRLLTVPEFDDVARKLADFVDLRSSFTVGHSAGVAFLAEGAGRAMRLLPADCLALRQAGLLHDLGRAGVPAATWNKAGPLSEEEWERMKRHPSLSELVLARSQSLGHLGTLAGMHHEKLDGSGYRRMTASSLPATARVLAAADTFQGKLEPRPHRPAMPPERAAADLRREAAEGRLDGDAVEAVLSAAGEQQPRRRELPAGLSEREAEVLCLAVRGLSNRQIAETLVLSPKTVGNHIDRIYTKIGVSSRVGATLFAVRHGLIQGPLAD